MADITWGSATTVDSTDVGRRVHGSEIDTNKFALAWQDGGGDDGIARIGTISDSTISFSGAESIFCADISVGGNFAAVVKLDTDKFAVAYADDGLDDDGYTSAVTVSGSTIGTWGTAKEFETGDMEYPSVCQLDTDKYAIFYNDEADNDNAKTCVCTVSSTTITSGAPVQISTDKPNYHTDCATLDSTHYVVVWVDITSKAVKARVCSVSGTVPTPGTEVTLSSNTCGLAYVAALTASKFVVVWWNDTDDAIVCEVCTVSGTTITTGTEYTVAPSQTALPDTEICKGADDDHFLVAYKDIANSSKGTSRYCSVSGQAVTVGDAEIFNDAATGYPAANTSQITLIRMDNTKCVVIYRDDGDASNICEARVGTFPSAAVVELGAFYQRRNPFGLNIQSCGQVRAG